MMAEEGEITQKPVELGAGEVPLDSVSKISVQELQEGPFDASAVKVSGVEPSAGPRRSSYSAGVRSTHSTVSRVSLNPYTLTTAFGAEKLHAYKPSAFEKAVELCKTSILVPEEDGEITGSWLLADIDHWDFEREMLIILATNTLVTVKFDFIASAVKYSKRTALTNIKSVDIGDFVYPAFAVVGNREYGGVRIHWSADGPWFYQRWNPWCGDVGFMTLTHHLLIYNEKERETVTYNASDFADSLVQATNEARRQGGQSDLLPVNEGPITIQSYANVSSLVYNQSHIGFNMDRGGVSF